MPVASETGRPEKDRRVFFAAERTFLAWVRTGLGLMGVGFAVARFGLFLREMRAADTHTEVHATGLSLWSGVAIVFLGVVVLVASVMQHFALIRELRTGTWRRDASHAMPWCWRRCSRLWGWRCRPIS